MNFEVIKNLQFSKLVKAENRLREFNFTRHTGIRDGYFTVDVVDDRGNRIIFTMKFDNSKWVIQDDFLPKWITNNTNDLSNLIEVQIEVFNNLQNKNTHFEDLELKNSK